MKKRVFLLILFFILINLSRNFQLINSSDQGRIIVELEDSECNLYFKQGWNLFSFCKNLRNTDLEEVFSPLKDKFRYIMRWNTTSQKFDIYSKRSIEKPFTKLDDNESYFIYMYEEANISIKGDEVRDEKRYLVRGWTAPSYQLGFSTSIEEVLKNVYENFRYIMKWNTTSQKFDIYSKRSIEKPFKTINKGEGQFIYMENNSIIEYKT